jgi:hypothetical protein
MNRSPQIIATALASSGRGSIPGVDNHDSSQARAHSIRRGRCTLWGVPWSQPAALHDICAGISQKVRKRWARPWHLAFPEAVSQPCGRQPCARVSSIVAEGRTLITDTPHRARTLATSSTAESRHEAQGGRR